MHQIKLTALKSSSPIGFMAALGTLRQANRIAGPGAAKLGWGEHAGEWCAVLHTDAHIEREEFVTRLCDHLKGLGQRRELSWAVAVKSSSKRDFDNAAMPALQEASAGDHELADWFAAFGSSLVLKEETMESTPLDMTVARQQFLADAEALTSSLATPDKKSGDAPNRASFHEALFGPWKYKDNQHSLGWDPSTVLMGAFTAKAPTAMAKSGVRAAVWLAMESLPFFPCIYQNRRLATRGFVFENRKLSLRWPVWTAPLSSASIETLLSQLPRNPGDWKARGIAAVYSSAVYKPNKYLTSFQAAVLEG